MGKLTPYEEKLIGDFLEYISGVLYVNSVIVYGSRSKGASNEYSDVDIAVVIDDAQYTKKVEKLIEQWNINNSPQILIHFLVIDTNSLHSSAIGKEIKNGDTVWLRQHKG
ncbi:MAG: nucleotidyltransferase domain-containing protein [Spirochaetota bacterium]